MSFIKKHKGAIIVILVLAVLVVALLVFFSVLAKKNEVVTNTITFPEKYADAENKINNIVVSNTTRDNYKNDLSTYTDKVKQDYNMTVDDKDAFMTFARKVDAEDLKSKMHCLSFYGKVKKQYDADLAANYFTEDVKNNINTWFSEYTVAFKEKKWQEAYNKLDEISKHLSVRITEEGVETNETAQSNPAPAPQETQSVTEVAANVSETPVSNGKGYHPEAKTGDVVVDPNNGNTGVVASNGIEVYKLPNESTYSYITKEEFVAMLVRSGTKEALARVWADQMANAQGLITIGVDDDGTYE